MRTVLNNSIPSQPIRHNLKHIFFNSSIFVKLKIVSKEIFELDQQENVAHASYRPPPLKDCARRVTSRPYRHFARPHQRHVTPLLPNANTSYEFLDKTPKGCLSAESIAIGGQKVQKTKQSLALGKLVTAFRMR